MIEIEQGTGKYVTIAADEETALRWSGDIGFKMMQYNQIRGVLPISQQYIDERLHVYYEVNKMQTLESMYAEAVMKENELCVSLEWFARRFLRLSVSECDGVVYATDHPSRISWHMADLIRTYLT